MVSTLIMTARLATLSLLEIKLFSSKGYDFIIYVHGVTKNLSSNSSYIDQSLLTLVILSEKLS